MYLNVNYTGSERSDTESLSYISNVKVKLRGCARIAGQFEVLRLPAVS